VYLTGGLNEGKPVTKSALSREKCSVSIWHGGSDGGQHQTEG
jgi:hypothetical protein